MDDALTPEQMEQLSGALTRLEVELQESVESGADGARPVTLDQQSVGRLSRMDAIQQQAMSQATQRNLKLRLQQCKAARAALTSGDYGYCRKCDESIGYKRLSARPESPFCLSCQSSVDRR